MTGTVDKASGGHQTLSGGTRMRVKTSRPWQVQLSMPETQDCELCSGPLLDEYIPVDGWKTFRNRETPFSYHRLLAPANCRRGVGWLRSLGGPEELTLMLRLALEEIWRTKPLICPVWIFTHVGYGAGQNFAHLHWHLSEPASQPQPFSKGKSVLLWQSAHFTVELCGVRAGQTLVSAARETSIRKLRHPAFVRGLATELHRVIERFNRKFSHPDYCVLLALHSENDWRLHYTPILNNWGASEYAALDYGTPFVLPWPREATRDLLLNED